MPGVTSRSRPPELAREENRRRCERTDHRTPHDDARFHHQRIRPARAGQRQRLVAADRPSRRHRQPVPGQRDRGRARPTSICVGETGATKRSRCSVRAAPRTTGSARTASRRAANGTASASSSSLRLAQSAPAWFWHVALENVGDAPLTVDLIHAQDLALADYGAVRQNEYYVSQYLDHTPLAHRERGTVLAVRQNLSVGGRHPWAVLGSLGSRHQLRDRRAPVSRRERPRRRRPGGSAQRRAARKAPAARARDGGAAGRRACGSSRARVPSGDSSAGSSPIIPMRRRPRISRSSIARSRCPRLQPGSDGRARAGLHRAVADAVQRWHATRMPRPR